jgi:hypothetical protein
MLVPTHQKISSSIRISIRNQEQALLLLRAALEKNEWME